VKQRRSQRAYEGPPPIGAFDETRDSARWRIGHPARLASIGMGGIDAAFLLVPAVFMSWEPVRAAVFIVALIAAVGTRGHYVQRLTGDYAGDLGRIGLSVCIVGFGGLAGMYVLDLPVAPIAVVRALLVAAGLLAATRLLGVSLVNSLRRRGMLRRRALLIGLDAAADRLAREVALRPGLGLDIAGTVEGDDTSSLQALVEERRPHLLVVSPRAALDATAVSGVRAAAMHGARIMVIAPPGSGALFAGSAYRDGGHVFAVARVAGSAHPAIARRVKRLIDLGVSLFLLVLLTPLASAIAVVVKLSDGGPILFRQTRIGQRGRPFELLKFQTMTPNPHSEVEWRAGSEGRVTGVGGLLRRTGLDELPQLVNIIRGEMSLVGPRPERPAFVAAFSETVVCYSDRHRVPVGVAGLAQVMGFRGDTSIDERVRLDNLYADTWSLSLDLRILYRTVWGIVRQTRNERLSTELLEVPAADSPEIAVAD